MMFIFAGFSYETALVYLDEVIVLGINFDEHLKQIELGFHRLAENGLEIKGSKYNVSKKSVSFLGHIMSKSRVKVEPEKISVVERMKKPSSLNDVRAFPGLVGYYRIFIPGF